MANIAVIAMASSTGGVEALEQLIPRFPTNLPPVLLVQHMPPVLTKSFAMRLNKKYEISVKEAQTGDYPQQGQILIAPGGKHMWVVNKMNQPTIECFEGKKIHGVMPAADVLFESVANVFRQRAIGVILTGMGADGARGLLMMRNNGAITIGQDKETSLVYGMPKVAKTMGAVAHELPLSKIVDKILSLV